MLPVSKITSNIKYYVKINNLTTTTSSKKKKKNNNSAFRGSGMMVFLLWKAQSPEILLRSSLKCITPLTNLNCHKYLYFL